MSGYFASQPVTNRGPGVSPPPVSYAIVLESLEDGEWTTVRLWDNADVVDEHHQGEMATRALFDGDPVVIVYPDGHELLVSA